ncbi:spermine synthase [Verrucomicrobiaceae bacterium N1E253]|uniref:Spermine synthase n=1 Tax=Oceaniferula marina TaxID=2748318 RepID=A0A851GJD4_9BACT|nr:spermine synthase [Oceaniferula marina]NWK55981.1 spermine synthase [Oceaniferula marina]
MKPYVQLGESKMSDGTVFSLHKHDGKFYLKYNGFDLMSTALTFSEELLADAGCASLLPGKKTRPKHPNVLIGGLGLGFTLKRTLELIGQPATVEVAELMKPLIEWNRTFLVEHNGPLLEDPRTKITQGDLFDIINSKKRGSYDALLLDIDNTPDDLITAGNARLYSPRFLAKIKEILTPNGCVAYWLSEPAPKFKKCLIKAGFWVEEQSAKPHAKSKRARHCIYVCTRRR